MRTAVLVSLLLCGALVFLLFSLEAEAADHIVSGAETLTGDTTWDDVWIPAGASLDTDGYQLTTEDLVVNSTGSFTGRDSSVTHNSLTNSGTYTATSGTTTITSRAPTSWAVDYRSGTLVHNSGTFHFTDTTQGAGSGQGTGAFYNVEITKGTKLLTWFKPGGYQIEGDLTITSGTFIGDSNSHSLTVTGATSIAGTLGDGSETAQASFGSLTIQATGAYDATSGTVVVEGDLTIEDGGTWTDNGGTLTIGADSTIWDKSAVKITLPDTTIDGCTVTLKTGVDHKFQSITVTTGGYLNGDQGDLTFTEQAGFSNSTGTVNLTGAVGTPISIDGPTDWIINATSLYDYWFYSVTFNNAQNIGTDYIVALGSGTNLEGLWDFTGPVITSLSISEDDAHNKIENPTLYANFSAVDTALLHTLNYTVYRQGDGVLVSWNEWDISTETVSSKTQNVSLSIWNWQPGTYNITFTASDCHNPAKTRKGVEEAEKMVAAAGGELVGKKVVKKKVTESITQTVTFSKYKGQTLETAYKIYFPANKNVKQTVQWQESTHNFKILHKAKTQLVSVPGGGKDATQVIGVRMVISADKLQYLPKSSHYAHIVIWSEGQPRYFYDADDFRDQDGLIFVGSKVVVASPYEESYELVFTHPDWKKNEWVVIDPLSGAINENSEVLNFTITAPPSLVEPANDTTISGLSTTLRVSVGAFTGSGNVTFFDAANDSAIGSTQSVSGNSTVSQAWTSLNESTIYTWYAILEISGLNSTSDTWTFSTGTASQSAQKETTHGSEEPSRPPLLLTMGVLFIISTATVAAVALTTKPDTIRRTNGGNR